MPQVAIVGDSGKGKSSSAYPNPNVNIEGLNPKETVILNVSGKDLPMKGWKGVYNDANKNYITSCLYRRISTSRNYILKSVLLH